MLFNRLQGGVLVLGGKDNGNGLLLILDDEGNQIGSFDASTGGFSNLYVADFDSPTVASYSSTDLVFFVAGAADSARGIAEPDDNNDGNGWGTPLKTISEALRRIPKVYDGNATIYLAYGQTFYETGISISGYSGSGTITIDGQYKTGTKLNGSILVSNHPLLVTIKNFQIQSNNPDFIIKADNQARLNVDSVLGFGIAGNGTTYGLYAQGGSYAQFTNCDIYFCQRAIGGSFGGWVYVSNCIGYGSVAGLTAWAGKVVGTGTAPGGASNTSVAYGGDVSPTFTYNNGVAGTQTAAPTVGTWTNTGTDSYSDGAGVWDNTTNDPLQGKYGSAGNYRGCWFFGSGPSSAVTGKTIKQIRIYLTRADRSGSSGAVNAVIRPHGYTSVPAGQPAYLGASYTVPFKLSEGKWVTLPSTFYSLFQSGSAKGIMIYTTNTADYMRFLQTAKIEITYA
jgi:hypothetical protein